MQSIFPKQFLHRDLVDFVLARCSLHRTLVLLWLGCTYVVACFVSLLMLSNITKCCNCVAKNGMFDLIITNGFH